MIARDVIRARGAAVVALSADTPPTASAFAERAARVAAIASLHADEVDAAGRFPHEAVNAMREQTLLGAWLPTSLGGLGVTVQQIADACEVIGEHCASTAMVFAMHQTQVASIMRHADDAPYICEYLRTVAREQRLIASAAGEVGVGGDVHTSKCSVVHACDTASLTKRAPVISYGIEADDILATTRRSVNASPDDQMLILRERDTYTLEQKSVWNALGYRGTASHGLVDTANVPLDAIVPTPYATIAEETMVPVSHLLWASVWLGIAKEAVRRARTVVREDARRQLNGGIAMGSTRLSELVAHVHAMRASVRDAVRNYTTHLENRDVLGTMTVGIAINNLKISASESVVDIMQQAIHVAGVSGYRLDGPLSLGRALRDSLGAIVMINNDRILAANAGLLLASR
jgi:acyl-CoA dehydrogenase